MNFNCYVKTCIQYLFFVISLAIFARGKVNKCNQCKIFSDSFNFWLQKTARGKHEGGDVAWEEAKLKSYSRSEMRLIEILEDLCTDVKRHQNQCYALAEEAEIFLEQWWVQEDPNSQDLFKWLCINTLQLCCLKNHYGSLCKPCPIDENGKICRERGTCDGEGTRSGNGSCICEKGYSGELCEFCAKNYYDLNNGNCQQCHKACDECNGEGPAACKLCKLGWELESGVCIDINECISLNTCEPHQYCVNSEGSFFCKNCDDSCKTCYGQSKENCTSCASNHVLWNGMCLDETLKHQFISIALKRALGYLLLLIITFYICLRVKPLVSLIMLLFGLLIYFLERDTKFNILSIYYIL